MRLILTALPLLFVTILTPAEAAVLWDRWYTVTVYQKFHYSAYREKVESKEGKIHYQYTSWKSEEGFINEESMGTIAKDTPELEPLFFHYRSFYRDHEVVISGAVSDGRKLKVTVTKNGTPEKPVERFLSPKTIFSSLFPVWFRLRLPIMKTSQPLGFSAVAEDNLELGFHPEPGIVQLDKPDDIAQRTKTKKISVKYRNYQYIWYLDSGGIPVRIEVPANHLVVEQATEAQAKGFLKK